MIRIEVIAFACLACLTTESVAALTCDSLLKTRTATRAQSLAAKIIAADADVARVYGFIGVTERELLELLNVGSIAASTRFRHSTDHPAFARFGWIKPSNMAAASDHAVRDAWIKSVLDLLRPRDLFRFEIFLNHLRFDRDGERLSPSFANIARALDDSNAPGVGSDRWARFRWLAHVLAVAWPTEFRRGGGAERSLVARLSYLSAGAGARLAVSERVADRLRYRRGSYVVERLTLKDVMAINANSGAVERFLEDIATRASVEPHSI